MNGRIDGELEYVGHVERLRRLDPALASAVVNFTGITSVLGWMKDTGRAKVPVDILGQDEFHYDLQIELEPGGRWVVFGVT